MDEHDGPKFRALLPPFQELARCQFHCERNRRDFIFPVLNRRSGDTELIRGLQLCETKSFSPVFKFRTVQTDLQGRQMQPPRRDRAYYYLDFVARAQHSIEKYEKKRNLPISYANAGVSCLLASFFWDHDGTHGALPKVATVLAAGFKNSTWGMS